MVWLRRGNGKSFRTFIFSILSIQTLHLVESLTELFNLDPMDVKTKIDSVLSTLLQDDSGFHIRRKRQLTQAEEDHIRNLFDNPLDNPISIDKYIDSDHTYNLSSAEMHFYRQQTYRFHRNIFRRFNNWQQRTLNESMIRLQHELESFSEKSQLQCDKEFRVPAKEGIRLFYTAMGNYRDEMLGWVKHTFVDKPKTLVREEKIKLEAATNETLTVRHDTLRSFWQFERRFANMMRFYEQEFTDRMLEHYDKLILHYIRTVGDQFVFPRTLPNLLDHLADNAHLFTLDLRNETTTEYCILSTVFTLNAEQQKACLEQKKHLSDEWA